MTLRLDIVLPCFGTDFIINQPELNAVFVQFGTTDGKINTLTHPAYDENSTDWAKYRLTYKGGSEYIDSLLRKFDLRENEWDFLNRKQLTYNPAHAKSAVLEVKNSIYQRFVDIHRIGGPKTYQQAALGQLRGVDLTGNTMNSFIGRIILPELLFMGKVGVFVDKSPQSPFDILANTTKNRPYLYAYQAEDIRSWSYDQYKNLVSVLLRDHVDEVDEDTSLVIGKVERFRLLRLVNGQVEIKYYDAKGTQIDKNGNESTETYYVGMTRLPFVIFELSSSLLVDIVNHQIAALNIASSDVMFNFKSNFPFYTEQFNPQLEMMEQMRAVAKDGTDSGESDEAHTAKRVAMDVGVSQGRRYPVGAERPGFINPSTEPLLASLNHREMIKRDIRQILNLTIANITASRASAESKAEDTKTLESGLSYIGLELEYGERDIGDVWARYEGKASDLPTISYPRTYELRTDKERREEAKELTELLPTLPSKKYQQKVAKKIAELIVGHSSTQEEMQQINTELDEAPVIVSDPEVIRGDHEAGFVSTETASKARLYPEGEVEQAKKDHAERIARIAESQANMGARGVDDLDTEQGNQDAVNEKTESQDADTNKDKPAKSVRGKAK